MPVDQWYDADTREAATARVLERRATKPNDRNVLMVVAEEFGVAQQTLRAWVEEAAPETATPARKPRPKFSQVVTRRIVPEEARPEPEPEPDVEDEDSEEAPPASADEVPEEAPPALAPDVTDESAQQQPAPAAEDAPPATAPEVAVDEHDEDEPPVVAASPAPGGDIDALEAEAATLRAHNEALKQAMRVLLDV
jgi:transposase-like protein